MFFACGWIWCVADVSSVSPSSEQTVQLPSLMLYFIFSDKRWSFLTFLSPTLPSHTNINWKTLNLYKGY